MWQRPVLAVVFFAMTFAQGALQGLLVWTLRQVLLTFDEAGTAAADAVLWGGLVIMGVWLLRSATAFGSEVTGARLAWTVAIQFTQRVIAKLLKLSVRYVERSSEGDLIVASWQDVAAVRIVTLQVSVIMLALARLIGLAVVAWILSPKLTTIGFVALPLGLFPAHHLGSRIKRRAGSQRAATVNLHDTFLQASAAIRLIKVNRAESRFLDQVNRIGKEVYRNVVRGRELGSLSRFLLDSAGGLGIIAVIVVGGSDVASGSLDWQTLLSVAVAVMGLYGPVHSLLRVYTDIQATIPSLNRIEEIFQKPIDISERPGAKSLPSAPETIELRDVSFAYDHHKVLDSISATFHKGETIGIVGPSGAGKSTLIALMLRLYDPTRGQILFDDVDIREFRHSDLLDKCAIVLQEPFLLMDTVSNNIRFSRPDASPAEVAAAARAANIHEEIELMENGYKTLLGRKHGRGVSVGQKQRICIAAALLKDAPILFLDEATSNLDSVSERIVQRAIENLMKGRTVFIIAHHLSTLRAADRVLVLDGGRLVGFGTHEELLETCSTYRDPWEHQALRSVGL
jgi:subfamily B ATP-binding cassette protein MsbA